MIRFLFKQPQPKRFEYKPRFYNERKERLQARIESIRRETENDRNPSSPEALRSRINTAWRSNQRTEATRKSNKNVLIIAAVLLVIAYFIFY